MDKNTKKKDLKLGPVMIAGGVVLGMILVLFLATSVVPRALVTLTRASSSGSVVPSGSYLIGERILAKADGKDRCAVNVFLLDKNGKGVSGKTVDLTGMEGIDQINALSDDDGKIRFEMTSTEEKQFKINASYNGQQLPQTIVLTFRN